MRFTLVDRITHHEAGKSLRAEKFLTLGEEYLADHFPTFPVMPGVLMLQAVAEAGAWLWRLSSDFRHPVIALREAKNVKYGTFMEPGRRLELAVDFVKEESPDRLVVRGRGTVGGQSAVSAQVTLAGYGLAGRGAAGAAADAKLQAHWRERFALLTGELSPARGA